MKRVVLALLMVLLTAAGAPSAAAAGAPSAPAAPAGPAVGVAMTAARSNTADQPAPASHRGQRVGSIFGAIFVVAALLFWSFGYGLLGGRVVPLSRSRRRE